MLTTTVITGATAGVGLPLAIGLARSGHRVLIGARDAARGDRAVEVIRAAAPGAEVEHRPLDLTSLASVTAFAGALPAEAVDCLVLNAAAMTVARRTTQDGFELMVGTGALAHHALVTALRDRLEAAAAPRIVTQSSESHRSGKLDLDDPHWERRSWKPIQAYHDTKQAQHVLAVELDRRWDGVRSVVAQPGWVASELGREVAGEGRRSWRWAVRMGDRLIGQTPGDGARAALRAALEDDVPGAATGRYLTPGGPRRLRGAPVADDADRRVLDPILGAAVWAWAEAATAGLATTPA